MQNELDFDVKERYQTHYDKLKKFIDSLEYSTIVKEYTLERYFEAFVEIVEKGEYITREVCSEEMDSTADFEEWDYFQERVRLEIKDHEHEMVDPKKVRILFTTTNIHEVDSTLLVCSIAYHRKILENGYDDVYVLENLITHIKRIYYKEKHDYTMLRKNFE